MNDQNAILAKLEKIYNATVFIKDDTINVSNEEMSLLLSVKNINNQIETLIENEDELVFQYSSLVDLVVALAKTQINSKLYL